MAARTITFGDVAENGPGMQHIGTASGIGLSREELEQAMAKFQAEGFECELIDLCKQGWPQTPPAEIVNHGGQLDSACLLVVRNGASALCGPDGASSLNEEQSALEPDKRAWMRGRVVNKRARWNLCFADKAQDADLENRKGTVVPFSQLPVLSIARSQLPTFFGEKARELNAELNVYYDPTKCGIGFHGDAERNVTIGLRLGVEIPFEYQWFLQGKPIGERISVDLHQGDLYAMGSKAVGTDWKRRKVPTLRHAAGAQKFRLIAL